MQQKDYAIIIQRNGGAKDGHSRAAARFTKESYILLGQVQEPNNEQKQKKEVNHTMQKIIGIIAVIAATAVITVLFITVLGFLSNHGI